LVLPNASGKSNFVQIFQFLRDIAISGLDNAVSLQGGVEYLRNMNIGASEDLSIKVVFDQDFRSLIVPTRIGLINIKICKIIYEFALKFNKRGSGFRIERDNLIYICRFVRLGRRERKSEENEIFGEGKVLISRRNGKVRIDLEMPPDIPLKKDDMFPVFFREEKIPKHTLILEKTYFFLPAF